MKLLVVHAHALLVSTLSALMQRCGSSLRVKHAGSLEEAMRIALRDGECAGVFVDVSACAHEAHAAFAELARHNVPAIAMCPFPTHLRAALECGAAGCLSCDVDENMLLSALLVLLGRQPQRRDERAPPRAVHDAPSVRRSPLTDRQKAVLRHLCAGDANKDIGRELHISEKTVKTHVSAIFKALGVSNRTQAVVAAREAQLEH